MVQTHAVVLASICGIVDWQVVVAGGSNLVAAVQLPRTRGRHGLSSKDVIAGKVLEDLVLLLLTPQEHRNTRHLECGDKESQKLAMGSVG